MKPLTNIFIGRSGCGKGTQVDKLIELIKEKELGEVFHLEAGNRFRKFITEKFQAGKLAKEILDEGGLQPEFLSIWAWGGELIKSFHSEQHLFIDGTPRRLIEAKVLESAFDFYGRSKVNIVYINVSRNWSIERMKARGRADDKEMADILARLDWFDSEVVPVLDYYRSHRSHNFIEINGEQAIEKVHQDIVSALEI